MTLIELMVSVSLMTVIVLGLYKVFDRTQKAMRDGANQVDTTETGRSSVGIILRDIEQMSASDSTNSVNFDMFQYTNSTVHTVLPGGTTNISTIQGMFFLKKGQHWKGVGYEIAPTANPLVSDALSGAGVRSLYRYEIETNILQLSSNNLLNAFLTESPAQAQRVADGVVHFRVKAYTNGILVTNLAGQPESSFQLAGKAPSHVEFEFGILEPKVLEDIRNIPNSLAISNYLYRQPASFQIYRSRVRIPAGGNEVNQ